jgi:hypothetical protein
MILPIVVRFCLVRIPSGVGLRGRPARVTVLQPCSGAVYGTRRYKAIVRRFLYTRKFAFLAAITIGSSLFIGTPSFAQPTLQFGIGPDGRPQVSVRDPQQEERERREWWQRRRDAERERAYEQGRRDARRDERRYGASEERCRNVTIEERDRWGRTEIRRVRRCD